MSILGIIAAGVGLASSLYGAHKSAKAAKEQKGELARQRAANEAWYNRNYYQDYLNTVQAQNALKQYRNAWAERTKEARARQAISGGTPEQAQAVAEAGGEAMGNMVGNLAAQGEQNKAAIDAQKLAMDNNLSQQAAQIAEARQTAASNLMSSGASMLTSGLQAMGGGVGGKTKAATAVNMPEGVKPPEGVNMPEDVKPLGEVAAPEIEVPNNTTAKRLPIGGIPMQDTKIELPDKVQQLDIKIELPDKVQQLDIPPISAPPISAPANKYAGVVAGPGKMAGINPDLSTPEDEYYSKNKKFY